MQNLSARIKRVTGSATGRRGDQAALGLKFVGPQAPDVRRADLWPDELPRTSNNVPTYHTKQETPATCTRQLDLVFATSRLADN